MSATALSQQDEPRWLGLCRLGQQGLPWVLSALFHMSVMVLLCFIWIVVKTPKSDPEIGPVRSSWIEADKPNLETERRAGRKSLRKGGGGKSSPWARFEKVVPFTGQTVEWQVGRRVKLDLPSDDEGPNLDGPPDGTEDKITRITPVSVTGELTRVVYLLDASGSMVDSLDLVKRRLYRELGQLRFGRGMDWSGKVVEKRQSFNVVFFRTKSEACWPALMPATNANKVFAARWADKVIARGQTDPAAAMKLAFSYDPQQIVVLSDGEFDAKVLGVVEKLQRSRGFPVRIYTIAYGGGFAGDNLRKLAQANGGRFIRIADE